MGAIFLVRLLVLNSLSKPLLLLEQKPACPLPLDALDGLPVATTSRATGRCQCAAWTAAPNINQINWPAHAQSGFSGLPT